MSRRKALLERFRAGTLDRIRRMDRTLGELEQGDGSSDSVQQIARDLHTFKGEARMLGLTSVGEVVHALEERLGGKGATEVPTPEACRLLANVLEALAEALDGDLEDPPSLEPAVDRARQILSPGEAGDGAQPEEEEADAAPAEAEAEAEAEPAAPSTETESQPDTPKAQPAPSATPGSRRASTGGWMQVNTARVDDLCEWVTEVASDLRRIQHSVKEWTTSANGALGPTEKAFAEDLERVSLRLEDLTTAAWSLRLVPVEPMLDDAARHARGLASSQGKKIRLSVDAGGAELERTILDELWEPLVHLVRNSVDHGIELPNDRGSKSKTGKIEIRAESSGAHVVLTIRDDGRGVDYEQVRGSIVSKGLLTRESAASLGQEELADFLFAHGFSTRNQVTDVSGRGVGLDVVRETVDALGGSVRLTSDTGKGTQFLLRVPTTISKERVLVVDCGGSLYGLPSRQIREVLSLETRELQKAPTGTVVQLEDAQVPVRSLSELLLGSNGRAQEPWGLVIDSGSRRWVLATPEIVGEYDLMRRPLDPLLASLAYVAASGTLDDGRLVLLLVVGELLRPGRARRVPVPRAPESERARRILVVDDSPVVLDLVGEILSSAGFEVATAANGKEALDVLSTTTPDLMLCDVDMPVMDGFELLQQIRETTQRLPIVMLTTRASAEDRRRATTLGADAYLVKSQFQETTLLETVQRFLQGAST